MAGPALEFFRFALYLAMPLAAMVHYGKPEWYTQNVLPYKERIFPPIESTHRDLPVDQAALKEELARIMAEKRARRLQREKDVEQKQN
ncbi:uncharacterized protein FOMMEDRAFT_79116 [Fomitiporia mediterranea MF3/22]|uniref:uncharacterized protein n=1 Tax=Fomitiporia mediterranea (strain MF3/22) TaxID=694068 RepID=UPI00044094B9|nr:uncharacterized protein FOMMEDRAFT_79116 [Fomitiporia mediterranea MF3/22]EJD05668.1 hypothetical protein FOMMEDRAFT_79116 [Fomitiporia mediterranea MF3/22]